ncbi:endonuclease/exonuclease/phosphatase family protein [Nitriliruptoraceae bacterium ZYF776]|nr:endonuclease/exonuclease/phosphatase family protein [Profundirhabdus halotolerans]
MQQPARSSHPEPTVQVGRFPGETGVTMVLTVASWNLDGWHTTTDDQLELLDRSGAQLLLAQEVTPASLDRLRAVGWDGVGALELLPDDHAERNDVRPRFGCAVLTRSSASVTGAEGLVAAPPPVRTLAADVEVSGVNVQAVSAALPPGSMWGRVAKRGQAAVLDTHLGSRTGPTLVGMDRNGPKFERWVPAETVWWSEDAPWLSAGDADHGLADVLDIFHAEHPEQADAARRARPDGPREVSYVEQRARPPIARRYDAILASDHWRVIDVAYDYGGALASGSDHALVTCRLDASQADASP